MELIAAQRALLQVIEYSALTISQTHPEDWTEGLIRSRLELLEAYWEDFQANHVGLLQYADQADCSYFQGQDYLKAEANYITARGRLHDARARFKPAAAEVAQPVSLTSRGATRLPRIVLPVFDGRRQSWESFRDLFRSLINEDASLTEVDKLYYLKTHVQGEAKTSLDNVQVIGPNYAIAWSILESRYDHHHLLVQDNLNALKHLRSLKEESSEGLQTLIDELGRHRDQLQTLGRPVTSWDDWFISFASDALDPATRRDWEEELENLDRVAEGEQRPTPSFAMLTTFFQRRCRTLKLLETGRQAKAATGLAKRIAPSFSGARQNRTLAAATVNSFRCGTCRGPHYTGHCNQFKRLNTAERRNFVVKEQLCFNCLRDGHSARNCPSPTQCQLCGARHHTLIHEGPHKRSAAPIDSGIPAKMSRDATVMLAAATSLDNEAPSPPSS